MRESARAACEIAEGLTLPLLLQSKRDQLALAKSLELIGEAVNKVSVPLRLAHPEIPWTEIVAMRHRLVHDCARTEFARLLDTIREHIPTLLRRLDALVPRAPDEPPS